MATMEAGALPARGAGRPAGWPPLVVAVVDHVRARFFLVGRAIVAEVPSLVSPRRRNGRFHSNRRDSPGSGERGFHRRRFEQERRHFVAVARRLDALTRENGAKEVVLSGSAPVVAALTRVLPPSLGVKIVGTAHLNPAEASERTVGRAASEASRAHAEAVEERLVDAVLAGLESGRAADGARAVLFALGREEVRTLLVASGFAHRGYRGIRSNRIVLDEYEVRGEPVLPVLDVVAYAEAETVRLGGQVVEIHSPRAAARINGVAALLRHR